MLSKRWAATHDVEEFGVEPLQQWTTNCKHDWAHRRRADTWPQVISGAWSQERLHNNWLQEVGQCSLVKDSQRYV